MTVTDSKCYQTSSGTSLTGSVNVSAGDLVLATITTRDTFTLSTGWSNIYNSGVFDSTVGNGQRMVFATQQASSAGTLSITVTQSSAQRLYINLISISGLSSISLATDLSATYSAAISYSVPNKSYGEPIIWGCSTAYWSNSSPYPQWTTSPSDLTRVDLGTSVQSRQANFVDLGNGAATGRTFTQPTGTSYPACIAAVRLTEASDAYYTSGTAVYTTTDFQSITDCRDGTAKVSWDEETPAGTSVSVYVALSATTPSDGDYTTCANGENVTALDGADMSGKTLYIKVVLSTTDTTKTPTVSNLCVTAEDVLVQDYVSSKLTGIYKVYCDLSNKIHGITVLNKATSRLRFATGERVSPFSIHAFVAGLDNYDNSNYFYDETALPACCGDTMESVSTSVNTAIGVGKISEVITYSFALGTASESAVVTLI